MSNGRRVCSWRFAIESTAPHRPGSSRLRRAFALLPVAAILACLQSTPAAAQNLPGPSSRLTSPQRYYRTGDRGSGTLRSPARGQERLAPQRAAQAVASCPPLAPLFQ